MQLLLNRGRDASAQAGFVAFEALRLPWVSRFMVLPGRTIPVVRTSLSAADRWGGVKARWGVGRMDYRVLPGLYAVGSPVPESPVFVGANYKMSFDALRASLAGMDGWMLILDTKGINVWCAAGKGSFGTDELVRRISGSRLKELVSHRRLVLPQLGAPGVSAPEVARRSGFRIEWGPVRAADIPAWLAAGRIKTEAMRTVVFGFRERLAIAPVELVHAWPVLPAAAALAALYGLPADPGWLGRAAPMAALLAGVWPVGTIAFPALLPWLPTRAFAVKGAFLGALWAGTIAVATGIPAPAAAGGVLLSASATAFLGMNFTGTTTFTCQPGALLEVEKGFWPMLAGAAAGLAALAAARLLGA